MRPPGKYDALRQAGQEAQDGSAATPQSEATQLDSAQDEPRRPTNHPAPPARYTDGGEPVVPQSARFDAAEIAREAKAHEDAIAQARQQEKGKGGNER